MHAPPRRARLFRSLPWHTDLARLAGCALLWGCVETNQDATLSDTDIQAARQQNLLTSAPSPKYPSGAVLSGPKGGKIVYLGMDASESILPTGKAVTLTHYFKVEQAPPEGWKLFVHVDAPDKRAHFTADHVPAGGKLPLHKWQAGDLLRDTHNITLPSTWAADKLKIHVGVWKGGERFAVTSGQQDGQNRVLAAELPVQVQRVAQAGDRKRMLVRKLPSDVKLTLDGKLDEAIWQTAQSSGPFVHTMTGAPSPLAGSVRALWDDENLYLGFYFQDSDVWAAFDKHDDKLWTQEVAEAFIDADGDGKTYIELQVSPKNITFDSWLPAYRQNDNAWDAPMTTAVHVDGTLNQREDDDRSWSVELKLPLAAARGRMEAMSGVPPVVGTIWRANFFRMDLPKDKSIVASAWSPPLVGDFHALDKFGELVFADVQGQITPPPSTVTPDKPGQLSPALQGAVKAAPQATATPALAAPSAPPAQTGKAAPPAKKSKPESTP